MTSPRTPAGAGSTRRCPPRGPPRSARTNALPEYPRPQLTRPRWLNLNGVWEYAGWPSSPDEPRPSGYAERILVPFPPESALSGIGRRDDVLWYRRLSRSRTTGRRAGPAALRRGRPDGEGLGQQPARRDARGRLHGVQRGHHRRRCGRRAAGADRPGRGPHRHRARSRSASSATAPGGICYTASSGIWQTVWLEPVPARPRPAPGHDAGPDRRDGVPRRSSGGDRGRGRRFGAPDGAEVARAIGPGRHAGARGRSRTAAWTPDDPHLYDLTVQLRDQHGTVVDEVGSYAGLRTIGLVPRRARQPADRAQRPDHLPARPARPGLLAGRHLHRAHRRRAALRPREDQGAGLQLRPQARQGRARPLVLLGRQAGPAGLAGHAVADRSRSTARRDRARPGARRRSERFEAELTRNDRPIARGHLDRRLGAVQRGLGRIRHRPVSRDWSKARSDPHGDREQRRELLLLPPRHRRRGHLRRPHLRRPGSARDRRRPGDRRRRIRRARPGTGRPLWPGPPIAYEMTSTAGNG